MMVAWSAAIAAGAFVILVIGILIAIRSMLNKMECLRTSAEAAQHDLHKLSAQLGELLEPAEATVRTLHRQLQSTEILFEAAHQAGAAIGHAAAAARQWTAMLSQSAARQTKRMSEKRHADYIQQWTELGISVVKLWQSGRQAESDEQEADHSDVFSESMTRSEGYPKNERSDDHVNT